MQRLTVQRPKNPVLVYIEDNRYPSQMKQKEITKAGSLIIRAGSRLEKIRTNQRDIHEVEGILEVQRQLLLKLAEQENRVMDL